MRIPIQWHVFSSSDCLCSNSKSSKASYIGCRCSLTLSLMLLLWIALLSLFGSDLALSLLTTITQVRWWFSQIFIYPISDSYTAALSQILNGSSGLKFLALKSEKPWVVRTSRKEYCLGRTAVCTSRGCQELSQNLRISTAAQCCNPQTELAWCSVSCEWSFRYNLILLTECMVGSSQRLLGI